MRFIYFFIIKLIVSSVNVVFSNLWLVSKSREGSLMLLTIEVRWEAKCELKGSAFSDKFETTSDSHWRQWMIYLVIFSSHNKNRFKIDQLVLRAELGSFIWVINRVRFFSLAAIMSLCYDLRGCCARFLSKTFLFSSNISSDFEILLGIKLFNIFTKVSVNIYVYPGRLKFQTY